MVTKSLASTPFGWKLIYKINGECVWSEYVSLPPAVNKTHVVSIRATNRIHAGQSSARHAKCPLFESVVVPPRLNTHWHPPLFLIFDSETMPEWLGMPDDKDLGAVRP